MKSLKKRLIGHAPAINAVVAPNPTNGSITFSMDVPETTNLRVVLVNVNGNKILELHNAQQARSKPFP